MDQAQSTIIKLLYYVCHFLIFYYIYSYEEEDIEPISLMKKWKFTRVGFWHKTISFHLLIETSWQNKLAEINRSNVACPDSTILRETINSFSAERYLSDTTGHDLAEIFSENYFRNAFF